MKKNLAQLSEPENPNFGYPTPPSLLLKVYITGKTEATFKIFFRLRQIMLNHAFSLNIVEQYTILKCEGVEEGEKRQKLQKGVPKKLVKSNESISIFCNFKNGQKSIFELGKSLKLT